VVWNSRRDSRKRLCFIHVTVKNSLGFTLQDCNRVQEHTRFLLLTRSTSVEGWCLRIEREATQRKIAECTSYTPCVLLSFFDYSRCFPLLVFSWYELLPDSLIQTANVIPKLNFVNRLLISKLFMSIKIDVCGPFPHCLSVPFQLVYLVCPTEIPQPPFAWKYYKSNVVWEIIPNHFIPIIRILQLGKTTSTYNYSNDY